MKKLILIFFIYGFGTFVNGDVIFAGRGEKIDASFWISKKGKFSKKEIIEDKAEAFCCIQREDDVVFGGALNSQGIVWEKPRKEKKFSASFPPDARVIYSLLSQGDSLYAAGIHIYMGGGVWRKIKSEDWTFLGAPYQSSMITSLLMDSKERLFAGGFAKTDGVVWIYADGAWNRGQYLNHAKEINTLAKSGGSIFAAGIKKNHSGGIWEFDGSSWKEGENIKFSNAIYCSTVTPEGFLVLGGAGVENKVIWENSEGFWNALELENCLSLYTLSSDQKGNLYAGGWNKSRKGRGWFKPKKKNWEKGSDLDQCFVVRGIS